MSRRCIGHRDGRGIWQDEGPSGVNAQLGIGGSLVVSGPSTKSPVVTPKPLTPEELENARKRFNGTLEQVIEGMR